MVSFDGREKYCISLMISRGGKITLSKIKDIIYEFRGEYEGLSEDYIKYGKAIPVTLNKLEKRNFIKRIDSSYELDPHITSGFVKENYSDVLKGMEINQKYKMKYELEFDAKDILDGLKPEEAFEYEYEELFDEINKAFRTYQTTDNYRSVITSCGRCVEMMIKIIIEKYELSISAKRIGNTINKLNDSKSEFMKKLKKDDKEIWVPFLNGCRVIYDFRNRMGAHAGSHWAIEQVANSCLLMTLYFIDYYIYALMY